MCRIRASADVLDLAAADKTSRPELFESRCAGGSCGVGLSSFFRRAERRDVGVYVRCGESSTVLRVDRPGAPSQGVGTSPSELQPKLEKIPSMVFDLELDDCDDGPLGIDDASRTQSDSRLAALLKSQTPEGQSLCDNVQHLWEDQTHGAANDADLNPLALGLQSMGYAVGIRRAMGGGVGGECLRNLRHSFLRVSLQGKKRVYIVDPYFRNQFDVQHPTPQYIRLFNTLPKIFVAPEDRVAQVVNLLCTEMLQVFKQSGTTLPPWRKATAMITKWLPRKSTDELPAAAALASKLALSADVEDDGQCLPPRGNTPFGGMRIKAVRNLAAMMSSDDEATPKVA